MTWNSMLCQSTQTDNWYKKMKIQLYIIQHYKPCTKKWIGFLEYALPKLFAWRIMRNHKHWLKFHTSRNQAIFSRKTLLPVWTYRIIFWSSFEGDAFLDIFAQNKTQMILPRVFLSQSFALSGVTLIFLSFSDSKLNSNCAVTLPTLITRQH